MRIIDDVKLDFSDVLLRPKRSTLSSRSEVSLERTFNFKYEGEYTGIPIIASNMDGVGVFDVASKLKQLGLFTTLVKTYSAKELISFFDNGEHSDNACISIGTSDEDFAKFYEVYRRVHSTIKYVCVDIANGYSLRLSERIEILRETFPRLTIIAGNVVTPELVEELILRGADIIKIGIGSGSACLTRVKTGVGYPQFSAIAECADAAHGLGGHVISDGGCTSPGDVAKAFAAGADFVMLGSMLAGHTEGGGKTITKDGKSFVEFYGMSSKTANDKHFGGLKDYRSSEGRTVHIPYKGSIEDTIKDILGGVRSACTYVGARELKHLSKCATFLKISGGKTHSTHLENFTVGY
jgi:GMP reductase